MVTEPGHRKLPDTLVAVKAWLKYLRVDPSRFHAMFVALKRQDTKLCLPEMSMASVFAVPLASSKVKAGLLLTVAVMPPLQVSSRSDGAYPPR